MARTTLIPGLLAILLAGLLVGCQAAQAFGDTEGLYSTGRVRRGDMADVVQVFGQVAAIDARLLSFETVSGRIVDVLAERGAQVQAGQELVRLDTTDLERQLREAHADLTVAEAVLAEAGQDATPAEILKAEADVQAARYELAKAALDLALVESRGERALRDEVAEEAHALQTARDQLAVVELASHASEIRKLEYDVAFFQRALRDAAPDQDRTELQTGLTEAERALAVARAAREETLSGARDNVARAQDELSRAQARLQQATTAGHDLTAQARLARDRAEQRLAEAIEKLDQANRGPDPVAAEAARTTYDAALAKVEGLQAAIEAATLRAPFAGVVFDVYVQPGQYVSATEQAIYLADPRQLRVEACVSEVDVVRLSPGHAVRMRFDTFPDRLVPGEVLTVSPRGEPMGGMTGFRVDVSIDEGDLDLRPGMTALVRAVVGERHDVLQVPSAAVRQTPDGRFVVDVQTGEGSWVQREVQTGLNDGIVTEVLGGLREGDVVRMALQEPARQDPFVPPVAMPTEQPAPPSESETPTGPSPEEQQPGADRPGADDKLPAGEDAPPVPSQPGDGTEILPSEGSVGAPAPHEKGVPMVRPTAVVGGR